MSTTFSHLRVVLMGVLWACTLLTSSCQNEILGLAETPQPLAHVNVHVTGDLAALRPEGTLDETPHLRVAIVWAATFVPDAFCALYGVLPSDPSATAVAQAGCHDVFGFVPQKVDQSAPVDANGDATLQLDALPVANVLVGDVTGRYGWATLVVFDDRNGNETLDLLRSTGSVLLTGPADTGAGGPGGGQGGGPGGGGNGGGQGAPQKVDFIYGTSFFSMTGTDVRLSYREGTFDGSGWFYPRAGCGDPPAGFSLVAAGGFDPLAGLLALAKGEQPQEDPATCKTTTLDTVVTIALAPTPTVRDVACAGGGTGASSAGIIRYRQPPKSSPDFSQTWACVTTKFNPCAFGLSLPGSDCTNTTAAAPQSLAIANTGGDCKGVTHYTLKGCATDPACAQPEWDFSSAAKRPAWWPCDGGPTP